MTQKYPGEAVQAVTPGRQSGIKGRWGRGEGKGRGCTFLVQKAHVLSVAALRAPQQVVKVDASIAGIPELASSIGVTGEFADSGHC